MDSVAFPTLSDSQIACIGKIGERIQAPTGTKLIEFGDEKYPFYVVVKGEVSIVESSNDFPREIVVHRAGSFTGDIDVLTGRPALIDAIAKTDCEVIKITHCRMRKVLSEVSGLSDLLLEAFQKRRELLEKSGFSGIRIIGRARSKSTLGIREFFYKNHVHHTFYDADDSDGMQLLEKFGKTNEDLPVVACNHYVNSNPELSEIASCLGITREVDDKLYDLIVVGAGPAGLAATVYAASEGLQTVMIDKVGPGGQAGSSSKIENFIGFPSGISGVQLANRAYLQALKFGAQFTAPVSVESLSLVGDREHHIELCTGQIVRTRSILISTGVSYRQLEIPGCEQFEGAGVYYAATSVEARVCQKSRAVVIGGGNSAGQAAMYLAESADEVLIVIRGDDLTKSMSSYLCSRIAKNSKIRVVTYTELDGVEGDDCVKCIRLRNNRTGEVQTIDCAALFIFIGARPHTEWLPESIRLDHNGFVLTGSNLQHDNLWTLERPPCDLETTMPGVMAAGDVRSGTTKRCGFAVGDGSLAVACIHRYLSGI